MAAKPQSRVIGTVIPMPQNNLKKEFFHKQIAIPTQGKIELIDVDQILFLKSDSNYTEIHLVDGSTIVTSSTLKKYEAKLKKQKFMRVHNSYIIQRSQLKTFLPHLNKLILHNTQEIPVSRSRKEGIMKYLKMLMV